MIIHPGSNVKNGLLEVKSKGDRAVRKWQILVWHQGLLTCLGVLNSKWREVDPKRHTEKGNS